MPVLKRYAPLLLRFALVGLSGFLVDAVFYLLLRDVCRVDHRLARLIAFFPAATYNWYLNRRWTFRRPPSLAGVARQTLGEWSRFLASSSLCGLLTAGLYCALTGWTPRLARFPLATLFLSATPCGLIGFTLALLWVYHRGPSTNSGKPATGRYGQATSRKRTRTGPPVVPSVRLGGMVAPVHDRRFHPAALEQRQDIRKSGNPQHKVPADPRPTARPPPPRCAAASD